MGVGRSRAQEGKSVDPWIGLLEIRSRGCSFVLWEGGGVFGEGRDPAMHEIPAMGPSAIRRPPPPPARVQGFCLFLKGMAGSLFRVLKTHPPDPTEGGGGILGVARDMFRGGPPGSFLRGGGGPAKQFVGSRFPTFMVS